MKISHSAKETYEQCPEKWRLRYQEGLRPLKTTSALHVGGAMDEAFSVILSRYSDKPDTRVPAEVFWEHYSKTDCNGTEHCASFSPFISYYKSDVDFELLTEDDLIEIADECTHRGIELNRVDLLYYELDSRPASPKELEILQFIRWLCLGRKSVMALAEYEVWAKCIHKVHSIQREVNLVDGDHVYRGFIDFEAEFVDEIGVVYVCDNKFAKGTYNVSTSSQLAGYCEAVGSKKGAYIRVNKQLRKKAPRVRIDLMRGDITEDLLDKTFDDISSVIDKIEKEEFEKLPQNKCFFFGKRCEYYDYCHKGEENGLWKKQVGREVSGCESEDS